ncbi:MAG: energy transducer TonB [Candidatus Sulfotelmatobacter sp.]
MKRHRIEALLLGIALTSLAGAQAVPLRARVSSAVMHGMLVTNVNPQYPPEAKSRHIQGAVVLQVNIDKQGTVYKIEPIRGHPLLAPAAIDAVKQWKYKPFLLDGTPVEVETNVTVNFTLADKPVAGGIAGDSPEEIPPGEIGSVKSDTTGDAPQRTSPHRIRVSSGVSQGLLVTTVSPEYPDDARDQGIQGVILLKANIDKEGNVYKLELISGHPLLAPAAIEAVTQWKYRPYLLNGTPIEVETQIQVNFTLTK